MKTYLVGGAVRDALLGLPVTDRDWVVVGATPEEMVRQGFVPVGRDFPVFLHPKTHEEYALARTERKSGPGYRGFTIHAAPDVSLHDDLARRDLTINSIAIDEDLTRAKGIFSLQESVLIDPWGGYRDLRLGVLRHVTPAFREDPVRILRVARLAARLPDFSVAPETLTLMREMVAAGEVDHLVPERVWQELSRGLMTSRPSRMLQVLQACGAMEKLLPGIEPSPALLAVLDRAADLNAELSVRFACLGATASSAALQTLCQCLRLPAECRELAELVQRERPALGSLKPGDAVGLLALLERCDAFRRPARLALMRQAADLLREESDSPARAVDRNGLQGAMTAAQAVDTAALAKEAAAQDLRGPEIGEYIRRARLEAIQRAFAGML
jgi:tRNA nucleotidyltransferase (CCA-adding enzyme)